MTETKQPEPTNPAPSVAPVNAPTTSVVYVASPPPHVPPKPNETPPGGKFGKITVDTKDGERVETVEYVNAHGLPFVDDPVKNLRDKEDPRDKARMASK